MEKDTHMVPYWMGRTEMLLGKEQTEKLMSCNVWIVGLGGVGGICAEMLVRAGIGNITIADDDAVDPTNCNRQVVALHSTIGISKTEALATRLLDINPELNLTQLSQHIQESSAEEILQNTRFDYAVDAIDTLKSKVGFIKACVNTSTPLVSAMGAGGKFDPTQVKIADIEDSYECRLARHVRKRLHVQGIRGGFQVVFSPEKVDDSKIIVTQEDTFSKKSMVGTISYMPAIFGCMAASVVIRDLIEL